MFSDGEPSKNDEPSSTGSTGGGGSQEDPKEPVSAPDFEYEDRGQRPGNTYHRDVEIKRTSR